MSEERRERPRFCSRCGHPIVVAGASFCKDCGAPLAERAWPGPQPGWRPLTALLLSVVPGLGHWYKGLRRRAVLWFLSVVFFYTSAFPIGFVLHLICGANAALGHGSDRHRRIRGDWTAVA